jgi:uncharacterized protein involved in exopolysaccharide biosynthesis
MSQEQTQAIPSLDDDTITLGEIWQALSQRWKTIATATVVCGAVGGVIAFILPPIYTAQTVILPPQQQSSSAASALNSLGALAGLAGGAVKSPTDQYISFMLSNTVEDRIIDQFKLMDLYGAKFRSEARKKLEKNVNITAAKKDGLITIEMDDKDPKRAAEIANAFVDGLRYMTNRLAVTEAQQRRLFFETKLNETKERLTQAQIALQATGFNPDALKAEPAATAESYARIRAEVTAGEAKLQSLRHSLAEGAPEVAQQQAALSTLRAEMARMEHAGQPEDGKGADYISKLREFKYQETLFELFSRQYEAARVDESREGAVVQIVDPALPPDRKSKPRRALMALAAAFGGLLLSSLWTLIQFSRRR